MNEGTDKNHSIERFTRLLSEAGIHTALVLSPENIFHLTGRPSVLHAAERRPGTGALLIVRGGAPVLVVTDGEEPARSGPMEVRSYASWLGVKERREVLDAVPAEDSGGVHRRDETALGVVADVIEERGLSDHLIGLELSSLPVSVYRTLAERFPEARFTDISEVFFDLRKVKTPSERDLLHGLSREVSRALTSTVEAIRLGSSEEELIAAFRTEALRDGRGQASSWSSFASGENGGRIGESTTRTLRPGDVVKFDGGVTMGCRFYSAVIARTYVLPIGGNRLRTDADEEDLKRRIKDVLYDALQATIDHVKPGVGFSSLFRTGFDRVRVQFPWYDRGTLGGSLGIGPALIEPPLIAPYERRVVEEGMVLAVEFPCYIRDFSGFNLKDLVLVGSDGAEILTDTPHYLPFEKRHRDLPSF